MTFGHRALVVSLVLLATVLLSGISPSIPTQHSNAPILSPSLVQSPAFAAPNVVQTSTAGKTLTGSQIWNQTGTTLYAGHSNGWTNFSFNPGGSITAIFSTAMTFSISTTGNNIARIYVNQGTSVLANTTSNRFTVSPSVSVTPVTERVIEMTNATGAAPPIGLYTVTTVATESIQYDVVTAGSWGYNNTTYRTTFWANSTNGYWVNSTAISVPILPGAIVNLSSLSVTVNGTSGVYQLTTAAIYILLGPISPGSSDKMVVTFKPVPTIIAKPPQIYFTAFVQNGAVFTSQVFYNDYLVPAYNGLFVFKVNYSTPISNVTLSANGHAFTSNQMTFNGNNISLLPGSLTVYLATQVLFVVTFHSVTKVPGLPGNSLVVVTVGASGITLGQVIVFGMVVDVIYLLAIVAASPTNRAQIFHRATFLTVAALAWQPIFLFGLLTVFYVFGTIAG